MVTIEDQSYFPGSCTEGSFVCAEGYARQPISEYFRCYPPTARKSLVAEKETKWQFSALSFFCSFLELPENHLPGNLRTPSISLFLCPKVPYTNSGKRIFERVKSVDPQPPPFPRSLFLNSNLFVSARQDENRSKDSESVCHHTS